jgi:predicted ABC-type transport system involved in lysophospholipase L1 biosynthesis ATPase subunit
LLAPRLLLCDEPTGQLDARSTTAVIDLLLELHHEGAEAAGAEAPPAALVVVTHNAAVADRLGRRLELREGRCYEA